MVRHLMQRIGGQERVYLLLDFDGTLVEKAPAPDSVRVDGELLDLLDRLSVLGRVKLAVVSGRTLSDLRRLLPLEDRIALAGSHGGEIRLLGESVPQVSPPPSLQRDLKDLVSRVDPLLRQLKGCFLESKPAGLALHYRQATPHLGRRAVQAFMEMASPFLDAGTMELLQGDQVTELRRPGIDKGTAVRYLLAQEIWGYHPVCFGDERTDEDAFRAIGGQGTTVFVGSRDTPTMAEFRLDGPAHVRAVLQGCYRLFRSPSATAALHWKDREMRRGENGRRTIGRVTVGRRRKGGDPGLS
jgi:trehalose-phosphatase